MYKVKLIFFVNSRPTKRIWKRTLKKLKTTLEKWYLLRRLLHNLETFILLNFCIYCYYLNFRFILLFSSHVVLNWYNNTSFRTCPYNYVIVLHSFPTSFPQDTCVDEGNGVGLGEFNSSHHREGEIVSGSVFSIITSVFSYFRV